MSEYFIGSGGELYHYGVKGMKWGVRRYQNPDGTLTEAGKKKVYKTLKKHANSKDHRDSLGRAVGEDETITAAARKVMPARMKATEVSLRQTKLVHEMEDMYEKECERLYRNKKLTDRQAEDMAWEAVEKKFGKQRDELQEEYKRADAEYKAAVKNVADEYLGKYGDMPVRKVVKYKEPFTAAEALAIQINWGMHKVKPTADEAKGLQEVKDWYEKQATKIRKGVTDGTISKEESYRMWDDLDIEAQRRANRVYGV